MSARRVVLTIVASLCGLTCVLASGVAPAVAGATQFGSGGEGSGQFKGPFGVGVDQAAGGEVYIAELFNDRIDKFDSSGSFLTAWGWNVDEASPAEELQTCTTLCQAGRPGLGVGQYAGEGPQGLAVDNDPLSASDGDVYVVDWGNFRVEKFDSSGKFILMFGGSVNETSGGDVCVAGEKCTQGKQGTADGQFEWAYHAGDIAVGPGGAVYVGDRARIQVFEPSGAWKENISLSSLSSTGQVMAIAVNSTGDMYVKDSAAPGVREFAPNGVEKGTQFDAGSESVQALALDTSGDLFVGDTNGGFQVLEYDPAGNELDSFGTHTVTFAGGMAFSEALGGELYVSNFADEEPSVWILPVPAPGPLIEPGSESAKPGLRGAATLEATVDPEGSETEYRFEYVNETSFKASGYASASSTSLVSIGSGFDDQSAITHLSGLVPGGNYHWRIVAKNANGTATGPDETVTTVAPALIDGPWAANVASTSATLAVRIDPLGASTGYRLEYGTSTSYGQTLSGSVGEGEGYVPVSYHRQELLPGTTYHYRIVTSSEVGIVEGSDRTFTTQAAGGQELTLPDGRAWELVSPPNKNGSLIEGFEEDPIQAASDGSGITYEVTEPIGEDPMGKAFLSQTLSTRVPGGWRSRDIDLPHPLAGDATEQSIAGFDYRQFSPDLSLAAIEQRGPLTQLSPEATEGRLYLRNDLGGSFLSLLTAADVRPGTKVAETSGQEGVHSEFLAGTPDLSHIIMESSLSLTSEVPEGEEKYNESEAYHRLYEWSAGRLQLVNVLPNGKPGLGADAVLAGGGIFGVYQGSAPHAISSDGRWVAWTLGSPYTGPANLYVRDTQDRQTVQIGGSHARFQTMSSDGSKVFFIENGELYEADPETGTPSDLTIDHGPGESNAGVKEAILGASEDGSYVYFVATGRLASAGGAVGGEDNLYVAHNDGSEWTTRYIATLSSEDEDSWDGNGAISVAIGVQREKVSSRVSPDGRYLAFMSNRSLTGYDNLDESSGQPDEEVYLYDAVAGHLVCVSCDPTGARPVGVLDTGHNILMINRGFSEIGHWEGNWLAGMIPGWDQARASRSLYQTRYLSNSGRLFFDSTDALVPQDTNGLLDAYEYEPVGIGSCAAGGVTFSERTGGCVSLISSGTSSQESAFFDASENGDDVFFLTASRLTAADYDTSIDIYDAHVCSTAVPCLPVPVSPPACTSGDSCKAAPSPQPEVFGPAPSATFSGAGNVVEEPKQSVVTRKTKPKTKRKAKRSVGKRGRKEKRASRARTRKLSRKGGR